MKIIKKNKKMITIWKYEIPIKDCFEIEMQRGARILCVQVKEGVPCIWASVDTKEEKWSRKFRICGTGNPYPKSNNDFFYIGTFQMQEYSETFRNEITFVWHLFEEISCFSS